MNLKQSIIVSVVTAVVMLVGAVVFIPKSTTVINQSSPAPQVVRGTSPEIDSPYTVINNVQQWYWNVPFRTGSTTLCSFPVPVGTSSLEFISWNVMVGTTTAMTIDVGTSTSPSATSSNGVLFSTTVGSLSTNAQRWTPTGGSVGDSIVFGSASSTGNVSTQYLNVVVSGASPININGAYASTTSGSPYAPNGTCSAIFDMM